MTQNELKLSSSVKRVLLIEDNPADAQLVKMYLEETDLIYCKLTHRETLSDALYLLNAGETFDAILCDLTLPDSKGFVTLERLINHFPDENFIVQTGISDKYLGLKAVKAGAQDYLIKGAYDADILGKSLRYSIERKSILDRLEETQRLAKVGNWEYSMTQGKLTLSKEFSRLLEIKGRKRVISREEIELPDSPLHFLAKIHRDAMHHHKSKMDYCFTTESGIERHLYIKCTKEPDSELLQGIIQDVTERRNADELRKKHEISVQAAKMKEKFLAGVSHEMRTPMNAILGMSHLVMQSNLDAEQYNYINSIKQSSEILLGIVNDILEISTLQNNQVNFDYKPFDLNELLANLINIVSYKAVEKGLEFTLEIEDNTPSQFIGDHLRLNQILFNLIGNAVKFTDKGFVRITVQPVKALEQSCILRFMVEDTGIGIPKDHIHTIFESFTRVKYKERLFEGTGLGLSIAQNLIQQQNGKIWVESEVNVGSKFFFELHFELQKDGERMQTDTPTPPKFVLDPETPFNLLLVEDNKLNQIVATKNIQKQFPNAQIDLAENGKLAIEAIQQKPYHVVLMDLQMPIMDGEEATAFIRNHLPSPICDVPILVMTAHAHIAQDNQYEAMGMDDFVLKPFEPKQLFDKIGYYVQKSLQK